MPEIVSTLVQFYTDDLLQWQVLENSSTVVLRRSFADNLAQMLRALVVAACRYVHFNELEFFERVIDTSSNHNTAPSVTR